MSSIPVCIAYVDDQLRYRFTNSAYQDWFGFSREALQGTHIKEILGEATFALALPRIQAVMEGRDQHFEMQAPYKYGGSRSVQVQFAPHFGDDRRMMGFYATIIDITDRKLLESELRQSQKMEALGTLTGGIAHDFNNVLFPILGFTELLLKNAEPQSEEHEFLNTIFESANRAKALVSQVLLFSRRGRTTREVCDLRPIAREVTKLMRSTLPTTISVRDNVPIGLDRVLCDSSQVHQVMLNLCINAGQAMPDTGELVITLENIEAEGVNCLYGKTLFGKHVRLAVTDTGVGMDEDTLSHVFDPFFTTKGVGQGTGLGLSTVYGIVRDHDGGLVVNSTPGRGTTFEVFLPVAQEEPEDLVLPQPSAPKGSETILFVDDEVTIVELCRRILEGAGYNVVAMSDSRMALETFIEDPERFDLVVTDQSMPNMKGEWLAAEMRKAKDKIPIILCTGHSVTMTPESSKSIGINAFLYKPVEPSQLVAVVRQVLDEAAATRDQISESNDFTSRQN